MYRRFGCGSRRSLRCLMSRGGGGLQRPRRWRPGAVVGGETGVRGIGGSTSGGGWADWRGGEIRGGARGRGPGGGRKPRSETDRSLLDDLRLLVEPQTRGDPQSPLLWTCKSRRKLSA